MDELDGTMIDRDVNRIPVLKRNPDELVGLIYSIGLGWV
jgi:hypothetical protein